MKKVKFDIQGMTCSSCSSHVEKAVNELNGVQNVNVNLLSNNMIVNYDETILDNKKIIQAVVKAGYGARVSENSRTVKQKEEKMNITKDNIKSMKKRLILSICFLIPLMYIAMYHMLYEWFGLPVPQIVKNVFHGNENRNYFWIYTVFVIASYFIHKQRLFYCWI